MCIRLQSVKVATPVREASAPSGAAPVVWLHSTRDCLLDGIRSPEATTLARLSGAATARIAIGASSRPPQLVALDPDVDPAAVHTAGVVTPMKVPLAPEVPRGAAGPQAGQLQAG